MPTFSGVMPTSHLRERSGSCCCLPRVYSRDIGLAVFSALMDGISENWPSSFTSVIDYTVSCIAAGTVIDS